MRPSGTVACSHCSASLPRYPSSRDAAVTAASREPALSIRKQAVVSGLGQHGHRAADLVASSTSNRAATTAAHPVGGATSRVTDASTTAGACSNCDGASQGPSWQSFGPASPALDTRRPHSNILEADTTVQDRNTLHAAAASALAVALIYAGMTDPAAAAAAGPGSAAGFTPGPVEVGWEIWFGAVVGVVPFAIGAYEFGKRILIQRRCRGCGGSGLVQRGRFPRKCPECGGFFPWRGWGEFMSATARPGNGGPLRAPQGQTSVFYKVPPEDFDDSADEQQRQPLGKHRDD